MAFLDVDKITQSESDDSIIDALLDSTTHYMQGRNSKIDRKSVEWRTKNASKNSHKLPELYDEIKALRRLPDSHWTNLASENYRNSRAEWLELTAKISRGLHIGIRVLELTEGKLPPTSDSFSKVSDQDLLYSRQDQLKNLREKLPVEPVLEDAMALRDRTIRGEIRVYLFRKRYYSYPETLPVRDFEEWSAELRQLYLEALGQVVTELGSYPIETKTSTDEDDFAGQGIS